MDITDYQSEFFGEIHKMYLKYTKSYLLIGDVNLFSIFVPCKPGCIDN